MRKIMSFFMEDRYFERDEKLSIPEFLLFEHYWDDDVKMMRRKGLNEGVVLFAIFAVAVVTCSFFK